MPKIIVTSRYIKPNAHKNFGNYIKYIATREGVEKPVPKQGNNCQLDREIFMNYLDSRPNSHGLFSETYSPIVLERAAKEVANHNGAIWTHIVSLKREDAERMGYIDLEHWRDLVRRHISDIAAAHKIADKNIRWYAAFHNKETCILLCTQPIRKRAISLMRALKRSEVLLPMIFTVMNCKIYISSKR